MRYVFIIFSSGHNVHHRDCIKSIVKGSFMKLTGTFFGLLVYIIMLAIVAVLFIKKEKQLILGVLIINLDILLVGTLIAVTFVK